jgi:general secretion pathway protein L
MSRLFVQVSSEPEATDEGFVLRDLEWVLLDDAGELVSRGTGDGRALAGLLGANAVQDPENVVVIVPGELCLWVQCSVPGRTAGQIRRALPFVVEEYLAGDVESTHLAHGPIRRGAPVDCVVVDRAHVAGWLDAFKRLGVTPGYFVPAGALLSATPDRISVLFDEHTALVRTERQALSVDADQVVYTLSAAIGDALPQDETSTAPESSLSTREQLEIVTINGTVADLDRAQVEQNAPRSIRWTVEDTDLPTLQYLARRWREAKPDLNLLQGEFAPPRRRSAAWERWRMVAILAGAWVVLSMLAETGKGLWANHVADGLEAEAVELYRQYFPGDQRVTNVRAQMRQHLGESVGNGPGFLVLVGQFGKALTSLQGAELLSVGFSDTRDELTADITVPGFDALDTLKTNLADMKLATEITSAEQQESRVRARLKVKIG